jgi:hypothetical protein
MLLSLNKIVVNNHDEEGEKPGTRMFYLTLDLK